MDIERRHVVVSKDTTGLIRARIANSGRNGGEDNYTYKTVAGATRRLNTIEKEEEDDIVDILIIEVKLDLATQDENTAATKAVKVARRFM